MWMKVSHIENVINVLNFETCFYPNIHLTCFYKLYKWVKTSLRLADQYS